MTNSNDRWDLSYLYAGFEDEAFQRDLKSLKADGEALSALLADGMLTEKEKLEKISDAA